MAEVENKIQTPSSGKVKKIYCIVCRHEYIKSEEHDHMHSLQHHSELDEALGKVAIHSCQACQKKSLDLASYANHILTSQHKIQFEKMKRKNVKPVPLLKSLGAAAVRSINMRNKELRREIKKKAGKTKKKQKQEAGQRRAEAQLYGVQNGRPDSKETIPKQPTQMKIKTPNQWQQQHFPESNCGVIQNKENKIFPMQKPPPYRPFPDQNWRPPYQPRAPAGQPFQHQYGWYQDQQWHNDNFANNHYYPGNMNNFQMGPYNFPRPPADPSKQMMPTVSQSHFNEEKPVGNCFITSGPLSQDGADLLDHNQSEEGNSTQPKHAKTKLVWPEGSSSSAPGDSENKSDSQAPVRDVDIGFMLKQIRRALGVREPCRADRETRRQNGNDLSSEKQNAANQQAETLAKTELSSTHATTANADAFPSTITINASTSVMPAEPNLTKSPKVRVAHKSSTAKAAKETIHKPILDKLHLQSEAQSGSNREEMYSNMKRKSLKGVPRFGTQPTGFERSLQEGDLPLSEGFHWESFRDNLLVQSPTQPCSQGSQLETQSDVQTRDYSEQPDIPQASYSRKKANKVTVKVEPKVEDEEEEVSRKRTVSMVEEDGLSDRPRCKKRKTKSRKDNLDQSRMDQLLAVSLREDELSHSLQDLDRSLIQARNALQTAYAEVQKLLLLKQQVTAEVNNLRTQRIEILQGMQEGYSGATPAEQRTSSPGFASTMSATSLPSSLILQRPAPTPPSLMTLPLPAPLARLAGSLKQEVTHEFEAGQTSQLSVPSALQPTTEVPTAAHEPSPESSTRQQKQEMRDKLTCGKTKVLTKQIQSSNVVEGAEENQTTKQDIGEEPGKEQIKASRTDEEDDEGNESDDSVEVVNVTTMDVIHIEESECEDSAEAVPPEQPEDPQESVSLELSCASTQTSQQCETERKFEPAVEQKKDKSQPAESVEEKAPYLGEFLSHSGPVHGLQIHNGQLYTCSGDNTARAYNLLTRECEAVFDGHTNKVNCLLVSSLPNMPARLYTGSSDQTIRSYSIKSKKCLEQITLPDRVLCLHIAWNILYVGLASGSVISHDLKTLKELDVLECHGPRAVSCLGTSQEGARRLLLVGSYDSTISVRDAKSGLLLRTLEGHTKTVLCMKVVNDLVFSGSSDTSVHAHNIHTGELVRIYKGHGHAVTSIVILGKVMVTACVDKLVRVYELQSHDRLQVYGGHSDMVMCMAVHKSVIYTGCYDGSVQAVKLNLMKNYRCWWQSCSLIFGIQEHLFQHLIQDHSNSNLQTVKCRWKDCNHFFSTQQSVRQELPEHMQNHIDRDAKLQA